MRTNKSITCFGIGCGWWIIGFALCVVLLSPVIVDSIVRYNGLPIP